MYCEFFSEYIILSNSDETIQNFALTDTLLEPIVKHSTELFINVTFTIKLLFLQRDHAAGIDTMATELNATLNNIMIGFE